MLHQFAKKKNRIDTKSGLKLRLPLRKESETNEKRKGKPPEFGSIQTLADGTDTRKVDLRNSSTLNRLEVSSLENGTQVQIVKKGGPCS